MNGAFIVQLVLSLLNSVLSQFKLNPAATQDTQLAIDGIQSAITALEQVHGSDVTFQQLESLRVEPKW